MRVSRSVLVARLLWIFPAILFALALYQANVARDINGTLRLGQPAMARVVDSAFSDRVDVSYDYVSLEVDLGGRTLRKEKMSFPHTFAPRLKGLQEIAVMVRPDADQPIVFRELGRTQSRIAALNAAMALVAALMLVVGVGAWNRYLRRKGDPAARAPEPDTGAMA